jgi:gliding motility-associated-like protein
LRPDFYFFFSSFSEKSLTLLLLLLNYLIMKARHLLLCLLFISGACSVRAQQATEFIENKGQWGSWFKYKVAAKGADICLEKDGFRYILSDPGNNKRLDSFHHGVKKDHPILRFHCYKVTFEGANTQDIEGDKPYKVYYNYFIGNDDKRWKSGIHPCKDVNYTGLYKGIDMHVASDKGNMVYDFIVQPQSDASQVKLKFEGEDNISIRDKNLIISTTVGQVTEMKPYAYQFVNGSQVEVPCNYLLNDNIISFGFPNDYDHSRILFIDPTVVFCTLTGSTADNWGFTATYDEAGNFYNGGIVNTLYFGGSYPVSPGAFQTTFGGGFPTSGADDSSYASDIAIIKYDPTGVSRIYATYLGGSGNDRPHSMIVDPSGDLIIGGRSSSPNYPVTPGAFQPTNHGGQDIIITKLNPSGTALVASTYLGGSGNDGVNFDSTEYGFGQLKFNYGDDARSEVQIDNAGNIYLAGCTNSTDFPTTTTAISTTLGGLQNGIVAKLNPTLTSLLWGTYIGGNGSDAGYVLAFDTAKASIYVAGGTNSTNFPHTAGALHTTFQGGRADGFILKFKNSVPYNLQQGTYIGTPNYDQVYGIQVSGDNNVYVMGQSLNGAFPVTPGVYSNAHSCQFVMKLDSNLSTNLISTVFGNGDADSTNISPVAFLVDTCENVYISGWGGDLGISGALEATGTASGMPVTSDAIKGFSSFGRDFYFIVLGSGLTSLRYATYYGRNCEAEWEGAHVDGGTSRFDKHGIIYQAMCANCGGVYNATSNPGGCIDPFPTTTGVWSMVDSSANCNEAALKIAFNIGPVTAVINAGPSTTGCAPLTVNFYNLSNNALTFLWNFGDGSATTTADSVSHTFTTAGIYTVTLAAANSNACFRTTDTAKYIITVGTNYIAPSFTSALTDSCGPYVAVFTNTSVDSAGGSPVYQWWYGDGQTYTGATPGTHNYPGNGTYSVTMVMSDGAACKSPDTVVQILHINGFRVSANFSIPDSVCLGTPIIPADTLVNVISSSWDFGNGETSASGDPTYTYGSAGTYTVTFVARNNGSCNVADTVEEVIKVLSGPFANFSFTPITATANVPTTFTNLSVNATRYLWDFGDKITSGETNPVHQYNITGTYKACLTAYNSSNCPSVMCKEVPTDVDPLVGIPSAFSPNNDGSNDILYVYGAAIATMDLKIFNRWGQLVFETTSKEKGWDGTYNGTPQPVEVYAYVLQVTFIDGTSKLLKGNLTLLR